MRGAILAAGLLLSYAFFYQAGGWNQNSRFDLVRAIVERGTLRIDAYQQNTGDKAKSGGHVYSDKAPGLALAAVPVAAAVKPLLGDPARASYAVWLSYLLTVALAGVPTALAAWIIFWLARRLGAGEGGAAVAAIVFGLASPAWVYATLLFGHAFATCLLIAAFAAAYALGDEETTPRRDALLAAGLGLAAGWATITEYPCAPPAVMLAGYALAQAWPGGWPRRVRVAAALAGGALVALVVLIAYNQAAFGSAFKTGYTNVEGFAGMKQGVMGVTSPKAHALWGILGGSYRGLFFHAPVLLAGLAGFVLWIQRGPRRAAAVALAIVVYYALFNSAYAYWNGGWSYGPRHMAPALPFLCLPIALLWSRATVPLRALVGGLAAVSLAITLVAVSTTAQPPEVVKRPLAQLLWPAFQNDDLSLNHQSFLEAAASPAKLRGHLLPHDAWNLGEKLGLRGRASLLPLLLVWAACATLYGRKSMRPTATRPSGTPATPAR